MKRERGKAHGYSKGHRRTLRSITRLGKMAKGERRKTKGEIIMISHWQPRTIPDTEKELKELRRRINLEIGKMQRQEKLLQGLKRRQKKAALERLEVAINTFTDRACFLKLSEDGNVVRINFGEGSTQDVKLSGYSGIEMLYNILKYGFIKEADR